MDLSEIIPYFIEPSLEMKLVIKSAVINQFFLKVFKYLILILVCYKSHYSVFYSQHTAVNISYSFVNGCTKEVLCCAYRKILCLSCKGCFPRKMFDSFLILAPCQIQDR